MDLEQAIKLLEGRAHTALQLANAPRQTRAAIEAGKRHRDFATAIALVLAVIPEGAR